MKPNYSRMNEWHALLLDFYNRIARLPSADEMAGLLGLASTDAVADALSQFEDRAILRRAADGTLTLGSKAFALPVLGSVGAGFPAPAEEELGDTIALDSLLIVNRPSTYLFTVPGDSMVNAGIMPRDIVLIDTALEPCANDIVVACIDNEWTMNYFCHDEHGKIYLQAANPRYPRIYPQEKFIIHSVVVSSLRCYR